jgi:hypothetical protein
VPASATDARGRGPALVHASLLTALLLLIATVALVVRAPAPPSIAEFAPEAVKQIKKAPNDQSSEFGSGDGECELGQVCNGSSPPPSVSPSDSPGASTGASPSPTAGEVIDVARVHRCVGNPPRQIEDPQSPPCVAYWKGDNGGATYKGVTKTTITVAYPASFGVDKRVNDLVQFFNTRFELYGRKIVLKHLPIGFFSAANPSVMSSDALKVDQELGAFASLSYAFGSGYVAPYYDGLARRGILSIDSQSTLRTEDDSYDKKGLESFQWAFQPSLDKLERNLGTWACTSLVGKTPTHAGREFQGTPVAPAQPRRFGVLQQRDFGARADVEPLLQTLRACNAGEVSVETVDAGGDAAAYTGPLAKLHSAQVSTIVCVCGWGTLGPSMSAATRNNYEPEWLNLGGLSQDNDEQGPQLDAAQVKHMFGLTGQNKYNPITAMPWFWAMKSINPNVDASEYSGNNAGYGRALQWDYTQLLLLASGIQMAGPNLTPESFRDGLFDAEFPNPGAGAPPYYQARVGFGPANHTMIQDVGLIYFDPREQSYSSNFGVGSYCLVDRGRRFSLVTWGAVPDTQFYPEARPPTVPCK